MIILTGGETSLRTSETPSNARTHCAGSSRRCTSGAAANPGARHINLLRAWGSVPPLPPWPSGGVPRTKVPGAHRGDAPTSLYDLRAVSTADAAVPWGGLGTASRLQEPVAGDNRGHEPRPRPGGAGRKPAVADLRPGVSHQAAHSTHNRRGAMTARLIRPISDGRLDPRRELLAGAGSVAYGHRSDGRA
jgi:hypothetical protein